ncbi:hypothetical protein [Leptospira kirschneri]|uniref:Uncharacterized protein n=1 Tax=Leptospira kirschneri str. 200802841 TaxID=1193047 RepID=A0A828XVV9_9LEPT|nr:hypothetical protein [Leptospira kirschneri]EJO68165.1 hypothetical protein LEP1GSC044_2537 [Leptospira kirschneri serovar Grippotyphosa str. RM52]EMK07331.1 hypothetical protein LEP1GSC176_2180 [Leptospira kirschneri str. MMD1493]EMO66883.1 hypothetical protein LEP1GSC132_0421 [Leptospira kirschneri str. 200803703]EPG51652.1 hypothetical protein LEP1GSC049_2061 [Leptospira kirschneri serovar Cynopteri str. 3522 CT]EKO51544.1 hypothetical protein LEP1GSC131_0370 [Leptospira kirschneri str. 
MMFLAQEGLNWQGISIMTLSLFLVTGLSMFCIFKLFKTRNH